jgi:hypothetical protein
VAPRFYALLVTLRAGAATAATRLERAADELAAVRAKLEKFLRVPARGDAGTLRHPGGWLPRRPGWLKDHEVPPGHTLERHVGKSADDLVRRLEVTGRRQASSFVDQPHAERFIDRVLSRSDGEIEAWRRAGGSDKLVLRSDLDESTGMVAHSDGTMVEATAVKVVLIPSRNGTGWQLLTAYPD